MSTVSWFTVATLHTAAGASLAVMLVVEGLKRIPGVRQIPARGLAILVAEGLLAVLSPPESAAVSGWLVLLLNGLLVGTTAIGGCGNQSYYTAHQCMLWLPTLLAVKGLPPLADFMELK